MADSAESPFFIGQTEEVAAPFVAHPEHQETGEVKEDVSVLVPLCARHAEGPQVNTAVFGYDIAHMQKRPWDEPGVNLKDYFNYGFNENSWRLYCAMQAEGEASLLSRANAFLAQLNGVVVTGGGAEEPVQGDAVPYYMQPQQGPSHAYYAGPRDGFLKTKLCQRFSEGRCGKGDHCSYAHGYGELRGASHLYHHHHHHHHHHHQQQQQQQQQPQERPANSYILPPFHMDQGVLPPMGAPPIGVLDPSDPENYRVISKRQRSPNSKEEPVHEAPY